MTTYTYDARGNQTQQVQTGTGVTTTSTYGYDLANRLISSGISNNAVVPFSTSATYAYNAQGQRVTRVEDEVITHFYYTGSALLFTTVNEYVLQTQNILDQMSAIPRGIGRYIRSKPISAIVAEQHRAAPLRLCSVHNHIPGTQPEPTPKNTEARMEI